MSGTTRTHAGKYGGASSGLGPCSFPATPVATESGHARPLVETSEWVLPLLPRVPITRVVDVTPLDFIGLPVWSAVTPLARDLTVHTGKGASPLAAKLSAIMEAVERVCAEDLPRDRVRRATFRRLRTDGTRPVLDPATLALPFDTLYSPDREIDWTLGYDVAHDEDVWIPVDAVVSPAREGVCLGVETNGLAAGNTVVEAVVHALFEIIERDAVSADQFSDLYSDPGDRGAVRVRMVDHRCLPPEPRAWVDRIRASGVDILVQNLTNDLGVPCFGALLVTAGSSASVGSRPGAYAGHGCDLSAGRAVFRAISEAVQAHSVFALGARDTFEGGRELSHRTARLLRRLDALMPERTEAFPEEEPGPDDLSVVLADLVALLSEHGHDRCVVVDLARPDLGIPVVRVIVPGLEHPYGSSSRRPGPRLLRMLV